MQDADPPILTERLDSTFVIRLNRPKMKNALDLDMRAALGQAVFTARDDPEIRSVIITGAGETFCAGGDLKALSEQQRSVYADRERFRRLHQWFRELTNLEKPVIAAVDGSAFGAGFNLALACDFVLATPKTKFCAVFARLGLVPDLGGLFLLPRIVGLQRAKEIVFSAREIGPDEGRQLGFVYAIHESAQIQDQALQLARKLECASTQAIGVAKNILNRSFNLDQDTLVEMEAFAMSMSVHSDYHRDAVQRFLAKQPLKFKSL